MCVRAMKVCVWLCVMTVCVCECKNNEMSAVRNHECIPFDFLKRKGSHSFFLFFHEGFIKGENNRDGQ